VINTVLDILTNNGYRRTPIPLRVADAEFRFDASLVGPDDQGNLIVVTLDDGSDSLAVAKRIRSFMLVLNRTRSTRPVSVVLVGSADGEGGRAAEQLAHTIVVDSDATPELVSRLLAPLLPLRIPQPLGPTDVNAAFSASLGSLAASSEARTLLSAARRGPSEVEATLAGLVSAVLDGDAEV
jgi:hypothetical protein